MGSDRARNSWDPRRQWRRVVRQQGRVTLEAEQNEGELLDTEELRQETLEIVGADGTPDDGYRIQVPGAATKPPFDVLIGGGTMYVGGMRAHLYDKVINYSSQPDWLHPEDDPLWVKPDQAADAKLANELIYLLLIEQEVGAVEDTAMKEVALGGPDGSGRTRLLQRIVRLGTNATDCQQALADLEASWAALGMNLDSSESRLESQSGLIVSFPPQGNIVDLCEPAATGGYLKPDNQLIRVQVVDSQAAVAGAPGTGTLVWGYDDAFFLYRATFVDTQTVQLLSRPVDDFHRPRNSQVVEVLRSTSQLVTGADDGPSELSPQDFVAAPTGFFTSLTKDYDPDTGLISLQAALPAGYATDATPIFVRVWEAEVTITEGTPIALGDTGMEVTVSNSVPTGPLHVGDSWQIAVRPTTPTQVYPQRLLDQPQPPDSPRMWVCLLGIVHWTNGVMSVVADCRNPFDNLVDLTRRKAGGCCDVSVQPTDLGNVTLQEIIDKAAGPGQVTICLMPGVYSLSEPLRLSSKHSNMTIEACHDGAAVIQAAKGSEAAFLDGLIVLNRANSVTLRGLRFELPQVPFAKAGGTIGGLAGASATKLTGGGFANMQASIGVRPLHCALLRVESCLFRFSLTANTDVMGAGILGGSECWGLKLLNNRFVHEEDYTRAQEGAFRMLVGYMLTPSVVFGLKAKATVPTRISAQEGRLLPALLQDALIRENLFSGLTAAAFIYADCGVVELEDNTVRDCDLGFVIASPRSFGYVGLIDRVLTQPEAQAFASHVSQTIVSLAELPAIQIGSLLGRVYPLPKDFDASKAISVKAASANQKAELAQIQAVFDRTFALFGPAIDQAPLVDIPPVATDVAVGAAVSVGPPPPADIAARATMLRFVTMNERLSMIERAALTKLGANKQGMVFAVNISGNDVDTFAPKDPRGPCLLVWDDERNTDSAITMDGNKFRSGSKVPTAMLIMIDRNSITGNVVSNETIDMKSLVVWPYVPTGKGITPNAAAAITGNVFHGSPTLPPRTLAAPLDNWYVFNALT